MMGGSMNNYYLNDGTGVIVLQTEGDIIDPIMDENYENIIGYDTIPGLTIEVGKKLPVDFMANIDFKTVTDDETWLPTGEVYGAPVMMFVPKVTGVDEEGWDITESNEDFVARCEASDFVEVAVEANLDDVLANRIDYAGKLLVLDTTANYYAAVNPWMGSMSAYMYWDASEAFDVEVSEEEGETYVTVLPKYTEDNNNFVGKLFNVIGEELPEPAFDAAATIKKWLSQNKVVIVDRYVYSNIGYQCAKLSDKTEAEALRDWIFRTEYGNFELPVPDLNIFLDVPIAFVESKLKSQRGGADRDYLEGAQDIHEADIEFQKRVREIYRQQCEIDPKFIRIDCSDEYGQMLPPDEIFAKVKEVVDQAVNRR